MKTSKTTSKDTTAKRTTSRYQQDTSKLTSKAGKTDHEGIASDKDKLKQRVVKPDGGKVSSSQETARKAISVKRSTSKEAHPDSKANQSPRVKTVSNSSHKTDPKMVKNPSPSREKGLTPSNHSKPAVNELLGKKKSSVRDVPSKSISTSGADKKVPVRSRVLDVRSSLKVVETGKDLVNGKSSHAPSKNTGRRKDAGDAPHPTTDRAPVEEGTRLSRERTRTRTIKPEDSKLISTLQHESQQLPQDVPSEPPTDDLYEDDFEDYESDFEDSDASGDSMGGELKRNEDDDDDVEKYIYDDTTSSESESIHKKYASNKAKLSPDMEERKMDSGHYDMAEERKKMAKTYVEVTGIREMQEKENSSYNSIRAETVPTERKDSSVGLNFINFAQAKKRQLERKATSIIKKRGELLLSMIRLDSVSYSLFDMAPVPYEIYMKSYGRSNTLQAYSQTNEERMSEDVQTETIETKCKWTQHPPALISPKDYNFYRLQCAVGSVPEEETELNYSPQNLQINIASLDKFLLQAGQVVLTILEEKSSGMHGLFQKNKGDLGFSQGFVTLSVSSVPFLDNREVTHIRFMPHQPNSLLTVHARADKKVHAADAEIQSVNRCILCVWSLLRPSRPLKVLVANADVTACSFHPSRPSLFFAGLADGVICVWDLNERSLFHNKVNIQGNDWALQAPSYATVDQQDLKHSVPIVGIRALDKVADEKDHTLQSAPTQICSVDESGLVLLWVVLTRSQGSGTADPGMAPWGSIRLLQNTSFSITQHTNSLLPEHVGINIQCVDLELDSQDSGHMYIPINTGHVAHCLSTGGRVHPSLYQAGWDCVAPPTCLSTCPYGLPYFLVGCSDGTIRLHTRHSEKPLLSVAGSGGAVGFGVGISCIQWSHTRPCVFFALDNTSRLHVWDLGSSDMYPLFTVPFKGKIITAMQLSSPGQSGSNKSCPYLALGTSCGKLKVHLVKKDLATVSPKETAIELDKFKRYVTIL